MITLGDLSTLSGTIWATLIGAVVGSVTGGTINLPIQITGIRIAKRARLAVKRQEDLSYRIFGHGENNQNILCNQQYQVRY